MAVDNLDIIGLIACVQYHILYPVNLMHGQIFGVNFSSHKYKRVGHKVNGIFSNFYTYPRISKTLFILNGGV